MPDQPMTMAGIPTPVFLWATASMLAITLLLPLALESRAHNPRPATAAYPRLDLLAWGPALALVRWRPFQFAMRLPFVFLFLLVIFAGLFGANDTSRNIAPLLTWTIWWASLVVFILFLGKIWCLVCPWNAIAEWAQRLTLWGRGTGGLSLGLRWPKRLRNIHLATGLFVVLTWLELGFGITLSPPMTAALGLAILALAVVPALYYDRKPFCRYVCLVGRISGLYALFSPVELRARDREVCRTACHTRDCVRGNERGYGCPTGEYLGAMDLNTYCILCSECVKTCPHDNVAFNLRPVAVDLLKPARLRQDEAFLTMAILSLTIFHGLTMAPAWGDLVGRARDGLGAGLTGQVAAFTLGMAAVVAAPAGAWAGVAWLSRWAASLARSVREVFISYSYALLPLALMYHLAHNVQHLLREGQRIVPLASDPFGWGWDLFGTAAWHAHPLVSIETVQLVQVALVAAGQFFAVYVAHRAAGRQSPERRRALLSLAPVLLAALGFSMVNLWLLTQPMQMRSAM